MFGTLWGTCEDAVGEDVQDGGLQLRVLAGRPAVLQAVLAAAARGDVGGVRIQVQGQPRV